MPRISAAFFAVASLYLLIGMLWGMQMGATQDHAMMPAHAHLNLLGWVTMALYGTFYALTAQTFSPKLAWTNFALSTAGVLLMIPALAMVLKGNAAFLPPLMVSEFLTVGALLVFGVSVVRELVRPRA